jgi:hypothetical protein
MFTIFDEKHCYGTEKEQELEHCLLDADSGVEHSTS